MFAAQGKSSEDIKHCGVLCSIGIAVTEVGTMRRWFVSVEDRRQRLTLGDGREGRQGGRRDGWERGSRPNKRQNIGFEFRT